MTGSLPQTIAAPFSLRLFGPFTVEIEARPMARLRSRKGHWILALLALRAGTAVDRDWLAGVLWPENEEEKALYSLRRSLADLRQAMGSEAWRIEATTPRTLSLNLEGAYVDVRLFDQAVMQNDPAAWRQAVAAYTGPLLEGCTEEWIFQERDWREEAYLQALERLATDALQGGEAARAAEWLRQVVSIAPFRETAQRLLLQALAAQQDFAGVILAYRDLRLRLRRDLNAAPDPETTALLRQIRHEARLRGAQMPSLQETTLLQETSDDSDPDEPENEEPPVESARPAAPSNLPQPRTSFVGHKEVIADLCRSLAMHRLVTLTGAGGGGKTRLAIQAATEIADLYAGGTWFVDLAPLHDPGALLSTIAQTLGISASSERPLQEVIADFLNGSSPISRPLTLLILDNCEHLLEACARVVEMLLCTCPRLYILTTSRQALGLAGEIRCRVPSLPTPPANTPAWPAAELAELPNLYPALKLFVERARSSHPAFALTPENASAVAQICHLLDGIPLAIELAAARVRAMPLQALATRLNNRFQLLVSDDQTVLPRHRTLRALVAWSVDLLSPAERTVLCRLAVFRDGWTLAAAEAVCAEEDQAGIAPYDVLDLLTGLIDRSLVFYDPAQEEGRYSLQETIRQYAWQLLTEAGGMDATQQRHLACLVALTREAEAGMAGPQQGYWLTRLERERYNLDAALQWATTTPGRHMEGIELAGLLARFWLLRGYWKEGRAWLERLLSVPEAQEPTGEWILWARAHNGVGAMSWALGDLTTAEEAYERSLYAWQQSGDRRGQATVVGNLGALALHRKDMSKAKLLGEQSLALRRQLGDREGISNALSNLGQIFWEEGDYPQALVCYAESLSIRRERNDRHGIAACLNNLGLVACDQGDFARADALLAESEPIFRELEDRSALAETLHSRAEVAYRRGEDTAARALAEESIALFRKLGERHGLRNTLLLLARVAQRQENDGNMLAAYQEGATFCLEMGDRAGVCAALEQLAEGLTARRPELAARLFAAVISWRSEWQLPASLQSVEQRRVQLREHLEEQALQAAWEQGIPLTPEQALALIQAERVYVEYVSVQA